MECFVHRIQFLACVCLCLLLVLVGCGSATTTVSETPSPTSAPKALPTLAVKASPVPGTISEFSFQSSTALLGEITQEPDGNVWFAETGANKIGRITPAGTISGQFPLPTPESSPFGIPSGADGNLWFPEVHV